MQCVRRPAVNESLRRWRRRIALSEDELLYRLAPSMLGKLHPVRALRWLALPLALSMTHVVCEDHADAKPKKTKQKKKTGPSMDDNAGRDVDEGGTAPGTTDSK